MIKKILFVKIAALLAFMFSGALANAQENTPVKSKTVVYTIKKQAEKSGLTAQQAIDIDKLLNSKKGILSSVTNVTSRTVTVLVEGSFPPETIQRLIMDLFKLEVESYHVTENTN